MVYPFDVKLRCRCIWVEYDDKGEARLEPLEVFSECSFRVGQAGYCVASRMMNKAEGVKAKSCEQEVSVKYFCRSEKGKAFLFLF